VAGERRGVSLQGCEAEEAEEREEQQRHNQHLDPRLLLAI
jgi:hypothetical protein